MQPIRCMNLIGGVWVESASGERFETHNPAEPDEAIASFPLGTVDDARRAIQAARAAQPGWAATPPPARGAILEKAASILDGRLDETAALLSREEGKTLAEARGEATRARDILRYYAGEGWRFGGQVLPPNQPGEMLFTRREPLGVISIITPWNFPIAIPAWKIAPALIYGNTVVFKPAEYAPQTGLAFVQALVEAGLPPGVLNFVTGSGPVVGGEMVVHPLVNGISFTGSQAVGRRIYAQAIPNLTRVQLEMGGKNPLVVLNDAKLDLAVKLAVAGGYGLTGQACTATSRVIVEDGIAAQFTAALVEAAQRLKVGAGLESGVQMGPTVSADQLRSDLDYIALGQSEGARLLTGGQTLDRPGYFLTPTVFDEVEPEMRIAQEEIFGPVIGVLRARDLDDAIAKANRITFGLSAGVVTTDLNKAFQFSERVEAGVVKVNEPTSGLALHVPFGGFKGSSANTFKEQGPAALEFYTRLKTVYLGFGM
jgi:aldehyde dehydrogenase (NAD+)